VVERPLESFHMLLRQLRRGSGMTQQELADAARLSARTVSALERGDISRSHPNTVRLLADALGLKGKDRAEFEAAALRPDRDGSFYRGVEIKILHADALTYPSDLLVLKYAQASYGLDETAVRVADIDVRTLPATGESLLIEEPMHMAPRNLLFLGVEQIDVFGYGSIREFSRRALAVASRVSLHMREISMTLHGVGFGLDETEAFEAELAGIVDALEAGEYPRSLLVINLIERNQGRATRMREALTALFDSDEKKMSVDGPRSTLGKPQRRRIDSVGNDSAARPHAFVAMPFAESFEDIFYYGITRPVRAAGLLCERIDQVSFTGDVIDRMRKMIASSKIVIADLSEANPNVYLEVGYAWGVNVPCILVCNRKTGLKFDLRGQRCLFYNSIIELEKSLSAELAALS
jgi:transcriptional regulator with XRE-family HTH domain